MDKIFKYLNLADMTDENERFHNIINIMQDFGLEIYISRGLIDKFGLAATGNAFEDIELAFTVKGDDRKVLTDYLSHVFLSYDGHDKDKLYLAMLHL